jgi:hypothetical protein
LFRALKEHLAVTEQSEDGGYIAIRISEGVADIAYLDSAVVAKAVFSRVYKLFCVNS